MALSPGASETWVPSVNYSDYGSKGKYNATLSSTHVDNGTTIHTPDLSGYLYQDSFAIGDLILQNQPFAAYDSAKENPFAVVLGAMSLSYTTISPFYSMVNQELLDEPIFTLYYGNQTNDGELVFGGIDHRHYTGDLIILRSRNEKWVVGLDSVSIGTRHMAYGGGGIDTRLDGSNFLFVFPMVISTFLNEEIGTNGSRVECEKIHTFPDLTLTINGHDFSVEPYYYTIEILGLCFSLIVGSEDKTVTLGQRFLLKWYSVYDMDKKIVKLAKAK